MIRDIPNSLNTNGTEKCSEASVGDTEGTAVRFSFHALHIAALESFVVTRKLRDGFWILVRTELRNSREKSTGSNMEQHR